MSLLMFPYKFTSHAPFFPQESPFLRSFIHAYLFNTQIWVSIQTELKISPALAITLMKPSSESLQSCQQGHQWRYTMFAYHPRRLLSKNSSTVYQKSSSLMTLFTDSRTNNGVKNSFWGFSTSSPFSSGGISIILSS